MASEGYKCIDAALANVKSAQATATEEADLLAIRALVQSTPGGFDSLDSAVRSHLHRWFEDNGAVKSARRLASARSLTEMRTFGDSSSSLGSSEGAGSRGSLATSAPAEQPSPMQIAEEKTGAWDEPVDSEYLDVSSGPDPAFGFDI
eukprot:m.84901 g.84901  ORF g.84901 m.84901 type:complete len:147 (+) comp11334_c0_seq1:309-749(+)